MAGVLDASHVGVARKLGKGGSQASHRSAFLVDGDEQRGLAAAGGESLTVGAQPAHLVGGVDVDLE